MGNFDSSRFGQFGTSAWTQLANATGMLMQPDTYFERIAISVC